MLTYASRRIFWIVFPRRQRADRRADIACACRYRAVSTKRVPLPVRNGVLGTFRFSQWLDYAVWGLKKTRPTTDIAQAESPGGLARSRDSPASEPALVLFLLSVFSKPMSQ